MNPHRPVPSYLPLLIILALLMGSALAVKPVSALVDPIVTNTNNAGAGSLRQAISDVQADGTITFSSDLSGEIITLAERLLSDKDLTIDGSGLAVPITISGNDLVSVFTIGPGKVVTLGSLKIIHGNMESGGGIYNWGVLYIVNSTLYRNAASSIGGIVNPEESEFGFINTIIAHSNNGDCYTIGAIHLESTHNLVSDGSCNALLDGNPKLGPLADNGGPTLTHALLPGSPAIDAGNDVFPFTDQRGVARPYGEGCDIGAVEFHPDHPYIASLTYLPMIFKP